MTFHIRPFAWIGLIIWLVATLLVRMAGQFIFNPGSPALLVLIILSIPLAWALTVPLFRRYGALTAGERAQAALGLVTLPLLLELPAFFFHPLLFPNMGETRMIVYAAFLFAFYGLLLGAALIRRS